MRLHFPQDQSQDVPLKEGETTIGSTVGNDVTLCEEGVQGSHATITVDARGPLLRVHSSMGWTHVNARPVLEKAILRVGDTINFGNVTAILCTDEDAFSRRPKPVLRSTPDVMIELGNQARDHAVPARALLRGISGPYFGKTIAIPGSLVIGRGSECDVILDEPEILNRHAWVEVTADGIYWHDMGSATGTLVNGVRVRDALLFAGDQIVFARNRFLIEAPGMWVHLGIPLDAGMVSLVATTDVPTLQALDSGANPDIASEQDGVAGYLQGSNNPSSPWLPLLVGLGVCVVLSLLLLGLLQ